MLLEEKRNLAVNIANSLMLGKFGTKEDFIEEYMELYSKTIYYNNFSFDQNEDKGEMRMKTLRDAKVGETVKVVKLHGEGAVKRRIMDMGITRGIEIYVRKLAPLGDPVEVTVRGYELSLRKADAEMIEVE